MSMLPRSILAGAAFLVCSAGMAAAYPATVTQTLNLRSGPGTGYPVVETMPGGARVNVNSCLGNGWCNLDFAGVGGYASGSYLAGGPGVAVAPLLPEYYAYAYEYPPYWRNGYYNYWYGGQWRRVRRDRSWWLHNQRAIMAHRHQRQVRQGARQLHRAQQQNRRVEQRLNRTNQRAQRLQRSNVRQRAVRARQQTLRARSLRSRARVQQRAHRQIMRTRRPPARARVQPRRAPAARARPAARHARPAARQRHH